MTAKHRKGRGNNKQEENSFKHEAPERDPRRGGAPAILSVLLLTVLIGGAIVAWFCLQQHQTSANLADTLVGMQLKMVKLQALQEDVRMTADKLLALDGFENRIQALEEVCTQVQKKVGPTVTSDLPGQVHALRAEVIQLAEWQQDAVTPEQLKEVQSILEVRTGELESMRSELEALKVLHTELAAGGPAGWRSGQTEHTKGSEDLTSLLELHVVEVTNLRRLLAQHKAQLDAATRDINDVRELLEHKPRSQTKAVQDQYVEKQSTATQDLQAAAQAQVETNQNQMGELDAAMPEDFPSEESVVLMAEEEQSDQLVKEEEEMAYIDFAPEEDGPPGKLEAYVNGAQGGQEVTMTKEKELGVMEEQGMEVKEEQELRDTKQEEEVTEEELGDTKEEEEVTEEEELADNAEEEELGYTEGDEESGDTKEEEVTGEVEFGDREKEEELGDMEEEEEEKEVMEDKLKDMEEEELGHFEEEEEVMEEEEELEDIEQEEELEDTEEEEMLRNSEKDKEVIQEEEKQEDTEEEFGSFQEEDEEEVMEEEGELEDTEEEEEELEDTEEKEMLRNSEKDKEVIEEEKQEDTEEELGHFQEEDEKEVMEEEGELEDTEEEEEELEDTEEEDEELGNTKEDKKVKEEEEPKDADKQLKRKEEMIEEVGDMTMVKKDEEEEQDNTEKGELGDPDAHGEEEKTTEELELEEPMVHEEEIMEERVTPVGEKEQEASESGTEEEEQKRIAVQGKKEQ